MGILGGTRQTRKPYTPFSTTCLHKTFILSRRASDKTHFSTALRSMHGMKNDVPGWNLFHSTSIGRLNILIFAHQKLFVEEV